jgi:hypothetical protein
MTGAAIRLVMLSLLLLAGACRETGTDEYLVLTGRIFVFNYRVATATYVVTFSKQKPVPDGSTVLALFDNPAGGEPLVVEQKVWPLLEKVAIESPPLSCVVKGKPYGFVVTLTGPDKSVLQTIESTLTSTLDQTVLPDRPLVVGPVYTPNPELAGNPGGKLPDAKKPPCPL